MKSYIYKDAYGYVQQLMTQKNPKLRWNLQENYLEWKVKAKEKFSDLLGIQNCISCSDEIEIKWIEEKEKGIAEAAAEWEGGSGEPMARNSAGIKYTSERCYYLISIIK